VCIEKLPPCGGRYIGKGRLINEPIPCDFVGSIPACGKAIFFDAKSSTDDSGFQLSDPHKLKPHQRAFLRQQADAGAVAGILVECKALGSYLWLYGESLRHDRIGWNDDRWLDLGPTSGVVRFDWLIREGA